MLLEFNNAKMLKNSCLQNEIVVYRKDKTFFLTVNFLIKKC